MLGLAESSRSSYKSSDLHDSNDSVNVPEVAKCPHCLVTVLPSSNDGCPSCNHRITDEPPIVRKKISTAEESKMIGSIEMMYNARKVLYVSIAIVAFSTANSYISTTSDRNPNRWAGLVVLACIPFAIFYTNYKIKRLRERVSKTTT